MYRIILLELKLIYFHIVLVFEDNENDKNSYYLLQTVPPTVETTDGSNVSFTQQTGKYTNNWSFFYLDNLAIIFL